MTPQDHHELPAQEINFRSVQSKPLNDLSLNLSPVYDVSIHSNIKF